MLVCCIERPALWGVPPPDRARSRLARTSNLPTKIIPTKTCLTHNFREIPYGPGNSTP